MKPCISLKSNHCSILALSADTFLGSLIDMYVRMNVCTFVGLGSQAEDITLGRMSRGQKSDSLTHGGNGHDSAAIWSWRLLTLHCLFGCYD